MDVSLDGLESQSTKTANSEQDQHHDEQLVEVPGDQQRMFLPDADEGDKLFAPDTDDDKQDEHDGAESTHSMKDDEREAMVSCANILC